MSTVRLGSDEPVIAHSVELWLPRTEQWIYKQLLWQKKFKSIVVADRLTESYPVADMLFAPSGGHASRLLRRAELKVTGRDRFRDRALGTFKHVLLHSHFGPQGWRDVSVRNKSWHITRFYGYDINWLPRLDRRWQDRYNALFERCDAFLTEGPFMKKLLAQRGCPENKIFVHRLGTDAQRIPFVARQYGEKLRLLMASRFSEKKGMLYALEGIAKAYHELGCRNLTVTVVGDAINPYEEKYKEAMLESVARHGMGSLVTMVGMKSHEDLIKLALQHDLFLHPSVTAADGDCEGGYPVVLLDMMATGLPVITTHHCDIPMVVSDPRFGILCEERNSDAIAHALADVASGSVLFDSAALARHIRDNFNWEDSGTALQIIYEKVMAG